MAKRRGKLIGRRGTPVTALVIAATLSAACGPAGGGGTTSEQFPTHTILNTVDAAGRGQLVVDGCTLLDTGSVFTQRIVDLPAATDQTPVTWATAKFDSGARKAVVGASKGSWQGSYYGMPLNRSTIYSETIYVGSGVELFEEPVNWVDPGETAYWEGWPNLADDDRHLLVLREVSCDLQEHINFSDAKVVPPFSGFAIPRRTSGASIEWATPIRSEPAPIGALPWPWADGAGLPITPLTYRFNEVFPNGVDHAPGTINHALRIAVARNLVSSSHVWPAVFSDGSAPSGAPAFPMGSRLRLKADRYETLMPTVDPSAAAILTALRNYGAVVADSTVPVVEHADGHTSGGAWGFTGEPNAEWPDTFLADVGKIEISDFEIVDFGACFSAGPGGRLTVAAGGPTC